MTGTEKEHTPQLVQLGGLTITPASALTPHHQEAVMSTERYRFDELTIDLEAYHLMKGDGTIIDLTYQEQQLLKVLIEARGRALSVAELGRLALGWPGTYASPSSLRNCLCRLRAKLGTHAHLLTTIRNAGYRISPHIRPDTDASFEVIRSTP